MMKGNKTMGTRKRLKILVPATLFLGFGLAGGTALAANTAPGKASGENNTWHVKGYLRAGYASTAYRNLLHTRESFGFGGGVGIQSPSFNGISFGAEGYTVQQPFGLNSSIPSHNIVTMPYRSLSSLGKAYLQYKAHGLDVKAGRFALHTPLAKSLDRRIIPATFQGIAATYSLPIDGLRLHANRITEFKPYNEHFNRYDTGSRPDPSLTDPGAFTPALQTSGFATFGLTYKQSLFNAQAWYYDMYDRMGIFYGQFKVNIPERVHGFKPFVALQYAHESSGMDVNPVYREVDSDLYGIKVGVGNRWNTLSVQYVNVPRHNGHAYGGGFASPYQRNEYDATPIFTNQPLLDMTEQPGHVTGISDVVHVRQFTMILGYTHMHVYDAVDFHGDRLTGTNKNGRYVIFLYHPNKTWTFNMTLTYNKTGTFVPKSIFASRIFLTYHMGD